MRRLAVIIAATLVVLSAATPGLAGIEIKHIAYNPTGPDGGRNSHVNREFIVIKNTGDRFHRIRGWTLHDAGRNAEYVFGNISMAPGDTIRIHTGEGNDIGICNGNCHRELYWGLDTYLWDNEGDKATLRHRDGHVVDGCRYTKAHSSPRRC